MEDKTNTALFEEGQGMALAQRRDDAAVARATQEIQAALVIGQRFPRDEIKAKARILEACKRRGLAEVAEYEYSRGGTKIVGPTIDLLRAIANRWGNILFGWTEVERREGESSVRCDAWDTQSNGHAFRAFIVRHWRDTQGGGYAITDERDIYEHIANMAARRVRACLEEVIDSDIVSEAIDQCRKTLREGEKTPLKDRAVVMVNAFAEFGVTKEMIETRLGNKLEAVSENQLASLRRVFKSLKDGVGTRDDYFKPEPLPPKFNQAEPAPPAPPTPPATPTAPTPPPTAPKAEPAEGEGGFDAAESGPPIPQAPATGTPPPPPPPDGNLKLLRGALRACRPVVKEGKFLGFLAEIGLTDGSISTLEELQMVHPHIVERIIEDWNEIKTRLASA